MNNEEIPVSTKSSETRIIVLTLIGFLGYYLLQKSYFSPIYNYLLEVLSMSGLTYALTYLLVGLPIFVTLIALHRTTTIFTSVGLNRGFTIGFLIALLATLPMLVGYALVFNWNKEITGNYIFTGAVVAAFFEELYYRGFLFGQVYRFTRVGFLPALLIGALVFAAAHLYQSSALGEMIGIFLTTFLGAGLFAWVYVEWDNNLWVPIWLHLLMNLSWMLFSAGENALGGWYANLFRMMTIALVIGGTIVYKKRRNLPFAVSRKTIWIQDQYKKG